MRFVEDGRAAADLRDPRLAVRERGPSAAPAYRIAVAAGVGRAAAIAPFGIEAPE